MSKLKSKFQKTEIILLLIVLLLLIINLTLYLKLFLLPEQEEQQTFQLTSQNGKEPKKEEIKTITVPKTEEELIKKLSALGERDRMEYYCGVYFKHLEKKEYESAYNLLYPEFKQKYFPTLEQYKQYLEKTYPSAWALEYNDITRQGSIYVLKLDILDIIGGSKENEISQRIVIKENTYNDFVISFQVI